MTTCKITVIHEVDCFQFVPSNVWIDIGWRSREAINLPLKEYFEK
ncbi:hypothetical protein [Legionella steigerwaltii]|nr:hypothetical protein [Legionella steigerwaltii]